MESPAMEMNESLTARSSSFGGSQSDLVFRDGRRIVDFVLVYSDEAEKNKKELRNEAFRKKFIENIAKAGLETEEEVRSRKEDTKFVFIKIHVPWPKMLEYAEMLNFRSPIEVQSIHTVEGSEHLFKTLRIPNIMSQTVPNEPIDYYTTPFRKSKLNRYLGYENQDEFFTRIERIRVAYEVLQSTVYGRRSKAEIGINRMVKENIFLAAYPLHEGPFKVDKGTDPEKYNRRQVLHQYWSTWKNWYKYQPLNHIREYYGEKIAFYFAWLGFYTTWLLPAALVGIIVFLYGVLSVPTDEPTNDLCQSGQNYTMCPNCEKCQRWFLSSLCFLAKLSFIADSPGSVFYASFISVWTVCFLQCWVRRSAELAHRWNCMDFEEEAEKPRPEFVVKAPQMEKNPVTGVIEPYFPSGLRKRRVLAGSGVLIIMASLVIIFIIAVIFYRIITTIALFKVENLRGKAAVIASTTGAVLNLIFIMSMSRVYERLAYKLTQWEMHRTQTEFEDHFTFKVFIFQFINFYGSIFYIAFFKGRFLGYPGNYSKLFGYRQEACAGGSCLIELAQQLFVIMVGKQIINNTQETLIPKLKAWWHRKKTELEEDKHVLKSRVEQDFMLLPYEGLFQEYLEMIIQFGFITIFVASFPLAPVFALLNNWIEIRLDANKLVTENRRPVGERAQDIGIWYNILEFLASFAVFTNAFLIAFTSDFLTRTLYYYEFGSMDNYLNFTLAVAVSKGNKEENGCRYKDFRDEQGNHIPFHWKLMFIRCLFILIFQITVTLIRKLIDVMIPDIPQSLDNKIKREQYLARKQLEEMQLEGEYEEEDEEEEEEEEEEGKQNDINLNDEKGSAENKEQFKPANDANV